MEYLGKEKFGVFVINNTIPKVPDKPWFTDNYPGSLSARGKGDIRPYNAGENFYIGNSSLDETRKITWLHIKDGNKHIYISDRVLLTNVSWNILNAEHMIEGKTVIIDGIEYKLRVLTGGDPQNPNNEWDNIIQNKANIVGLPKPTQGDLTPTNTYEQLDGENNQHWNWWGVRTICQETLYSRGYTGASGIISSSPPERSLALGWRPVLEYIEIDPPGKPIPVYPTSEDRTHPEPIQGEITLQTKYNGEGSLELMDVFVYNYTQQEFEYKSGEVANTTGVMQLPVTFEAGSNYKITVRHKGTGGYTKEWLELYVIGGVLGKYKISEPITVNQFDPIKTYTGGENLVMKPQTFPETENSKIRLVPQTMNTLTVKEDTTTEEVKYSGATKTPTIGDRLIKDKEVYTISNVVEEQSEINVSTEITTVTDATNTSLSWSNGTGKKSYVYNGRVYFVYCKNNTTAFISSVPLEGGTMTIHNSNNYTNINSVTMTGKNNMIYTVIAEASKITIKLVNVDTNVSKTKELSMANTVYSVSATVDSQTNHLVVATKEYDTMYHIKCYWFDVSNPDNITTFASRVLQSAADNNSLSFPVVEDTQDYREGNISICYTQSYLETNMLYLIESIQKASGQVSQVSRGSGDGINAVNSCICSKLFKDNSGKFTWMIACSYSESASNYKIRTFKQYQKADGSYSNYISTLDSVYTRIPSTVKLTYDKSQNFSLVYSTGDGVIRQTHSQSVDVGWGEISTVTSVAERGSAKVFEIVDYNPESYGKYPGLLILEYDDASKTDRLMLRSDYSMEALTPNKVILDKPITAQAGEIIKFLDYDLEVKAGEETATITPTNITEDYYEYDAKFDKMEAERKVTVVGRNSKLTTLYYYNY